MRAVFADESLIRTWLAVEAALAEAEARLGLIPADAAHEIARRARSERFDVGELRRAIERADHPLVPLIWAFAERCADGAGAYVHWGATTQDVMDTATVLQLRAALAIVERRCGELAELLARLARAERGTVLAGRTHGQQALPITFGLKAASWLAELLRHEQRLAELRPRLLVGQLAGAAGTLASLGEAGPAVRAELCRILELGEPLAPWHVARDALAELACVLAMLAASCARIAGEVVQLQKTEIGELEEGQAEGNVGSSTMPQKRNPMTAESVVAASSLARASVAAALEAMLGEHERDMGRWQAEWHLLPEACLLADAALVQILDVMSSLRVDRGRMARNLELTQGLIMAEAVMMALAPSLGRQRAHDLVHAAAARSQLGGLRFLDELCAEPLVAAQLSRAELERLLEPASYLGSAGRVVDDVLAEHERRSRA
jgi:3-carboxy-cis,cis-muconate cycloisomerase